MKTNNSPLHYSNYTNFRKKKYHYVVENQYIYNKETWTTFISSTMVTVLLRALPIALNTISDEPFSWKPVGKSEKQYKPNHLKR